MPKITAQQRKDMESLAGRMEKPGFAWHWLRAEDCLLILKFFPILASHIESNYPVLKILEDHLLAGACLANQDDRWCLFEDDGEEIANGKTLQELLENLIFSKC